MTGKDKGARVGMIITAEMLEHYEACEEQLERFRELFPDGVEVTEELCIKHAADFNLDWAAQYLLPIRARWAYNEARNVAAEAYCKAKDSLWYMLVKAQRDEARKSAWQAYQEAKAFAFARSAEIARKE